MAVFLVLGLVVLGFSGMQRGERGVFGGPLPQLAGSLTQEAGSALIAKSVAAGLKSPELGHDQPLILEGSIQDNGGFFSSSNYAGVVTYVVKRGDTLSGIAAQFGISVQTIIASNPQVKAGALQIGQKLNVLPVSGIVYSVKDGETAESVAASFDLGVSQLKEFNRSVDFNNLAAGTTLVIPGASPLASGLLAKSSGLPDLKGYFMQPAEGFNWGVLHPHNAVDIANVCGTPIVASAEGLVVDVSLDSWSEGYGHNIVIEHPNGVKTRYAHLDKVFASLGDYVKQGEQIGTMGQTGDATGCHVHFEVLGAVNPFAR